MTLFFLLASLLVIAALSILLPLLNGNRVGNDLDHREANIAIARERQDTLRRAFDAGEIDEESYQTEIGSLEDALASDLASGKREPDDARGQWFAIAAVIILVPISAGVLYMQLGTPQAMDPLHVADLTRQAQDQASAEATARALAEGNGEQQQAAIEDLIPQLERRLADSPDDIEGWRLLGRTRLMTGDFEAARDALATANELAPDHPDTLASLAEATAMATGGNLAGKPVALLEQALANEPNHPQSRWLLGIAHQQAGEHQAAIALFNGLLTDFAGDAEAVASVQQMIDRSTQAIAGEDPASTPENGGANTQSANASDGSSMPGEQNPSGQTAAAVTARISLELPPGTDLEPTQPVFVYAKAIDGPPMPLAATRLTVADLPAEITLDDSTSLLPGMTISGFDTVTIGARVSLTGDAVAKPGDWLGEVSPVATRNGKPVSVKINQQVTD